MSIVYFTDRDLGLRFPEILREAGLQVQRHQDHFKHNTADEKWLATIGRKKWVAITHNLRIRYTPNERAAVIRHNVRLLVIVGKAPFPELARFFVNTSGRIAAFLERNPPPLIAKIYRASPSDLEHDPKAPGRVERWYPE